MEPAKLIERQAPSVDDLATEHEERVEKRAEEAAARIAKGQHWLDWLAIGEGLVVGRQRAMRRSGTNRPEGSAYNRCFGDWMDGHKWARDLDKATRNHSMWCADHRDEIERWRETLASNVRNNMNHPTTIKRRYEASHAIEKDASERQKTETKAQQLERRCAELEDELIEAKKKNADGMFDPAKIKATELVRCVMESGVGWSYIQTMQRELNKRIEEAKAKKRERDHDNKTLQATLEHQGRG
jgi:hypothetical protein